MKKGFTIIELLMVVVLIGLLSILIIPNVNRLVNKSTQTLSSVQVKSIESSAMNFITDYYDYVKDYDVFTVELKMLKDMSYVETDIKNVNTGKYFSDDSLVTFTKDGENYKASFSGFDSDYISSITEYKNHIVLLNGGSPFLNSVIANPSNAVLMSKEGNIYKTTVYSTEVETGSTNADNTRNITYNLTLVEESSQYNFSITRKESTDLSVIGPEFTISTTTNLDKSQLTMTIVPTNVELGVNPYSFDNGVTWQSSSSKVITSSYDGVIKLKDIDGKIGILNYNISKLTVLANGGVWNSLSGDSYFWLVNGINMVISNPIRPGYSFTGWALSGVGSSISGTTFTMGSSDASLLAGWIANNYTLTVNANGGTWSGTTPQTVSCGSVITLATPTRTGYTFSGWSVSGTGSSVSGSSLTMGSADATLTANWSVSSYTLTVNANGGSWSGTTPQNVNYGASITVANPTRSAYIFSGWTLSGTGSTISGTTFTMGTANTTLTANWILLSTIYIYTGTSTLIEDGNNNWRIKFLTNGTFTPSINLVIDAFLVGGGGSGYTWYGNTGAGGGGGGYTKTQKTINLTGGTSYSIVIGAGGNGTSGGTTTAFGYSAAGGAGGGSSSNGGAGGSGGGAHVSAGGVDGAKGGDWLGGPAYGGAGQGTSTREFGEPSGTLYSTGGAGNPGGCDYASGAANTGNGGMGAWWDCGYFGYGGSGIVVIRNNR